MFAPLLIVLALGANEFVLAYSDDGASALTQNGAVLRLIGPKTAQRFDAGRGSVGECKATVLALQKALPKFTGLEISVKGCGKTQRDTIVRTLKRHADDAKQAQLPRDRFVVKDGGLMIEGLPPIDLGGASPVQVAVSPSRRLVLVLAAEAGGAAIVRAATIERDAISYVDLSSPTSPAPR